jgi:hypothetical protein
MFFLFAPSRAHALAFKELVYVDLSNVRLFLNNIISVSATTTQTNGSTTQSQGKSKFILSTFSKCQPRNRRENYIYT